MKAANVIQKRNQRRAARRVRVRKKIRGTANRPRLSVFRSNRYVYAQLIDDVAGRTLAAASSLDSELQGEQGSSKSLSAAAAVGQRIAELAKEQKITEVVFDKGWYRYHGRIKALADAARETGLKL